MIAKKMIPLQTIVQRIPKNQSPSRQRSPSNIINKQNYIGERDQSPNKLNATRKPMINIPKQVQTRRNQASSLLERQQIHLRNLNTCTNHQNKLAEFFVKLKTDTIYCCEKCAAQMASQGFNVYKACQQTEPTTNNNSYQSKTNTFQNIYKPRKLAYNPKLHNNPLYLQICQVLKYAYSLQQKHYENIESFTGIQSQFKSEIILTQRYYDKLLLIVQQMRDQHLSDLYDEARKLSQVSCIEVDYLKDNLGEIQHMIDDIEKNVEEIVTKISQNDFQQTIGEYKSLLNLFKHKVEQQDQKIREIPFNSEPQIQNKITQVIEFLKNVWNNDHHSQQKNQNKANHINYSNQISHANHINPNNFYSNGHKAEMNKLSQQTAFRALFSSSQNDYLEILETSPKFKMM